MSQGVAKLILLEPYALVNLARGSLLCFMTYNTAALTTYMLKLTHAVGAWLGVAEASNPSQPSPLGAWLHAWPKPTVV